MSAITSSPKPGAELKLFSLGLVVSIRTSNRNIILAEDSYKKAQRSRKDVYENSLTGMDKRITQIKSYLASFAGGKKSAHYVAYAAAIKGV